MFLQLVGLHIGDYELFICSFIVGFCKSGRRGFYLLV